MKEDSLRMELNILPPADTFILNEYNRLVRYFNQLHETDLKDARERQSARALFETLKCAFSTGASNSDRLLETIIAMRIIGEYEWLRDDEVARNPELLKRLLVLQERALLEAASSDSVFIQSPPSGNPRLQ